MKVFRAHDGRGFDVKQRLSHFHAVEDVIDTFSLVTGIPSDAIICMASSGAQLSHEVLEDAKRHEEAETRGQPSRSQQEEEMAFFVFNREFLYADLDAVAMQLEEPLTLDPPLQGAHKPVSAYTVTFSTDRRESGIAEFELAQPPTPRSLSSLLEWSSQLLEQLDLHSTLAGELHDHLATIQRSTSVALLNLLSHAATVRNTSSGIQGTTTRELERLQGLLDGHERDLKVLDLISINPRLLPSPADKSTAQASGGGAPGVTSGIRGVQPRERRLGHYIHQDKMTAVFTACSAVHEELRGRCEELAARDMELAADTEGLRTEVEGTSIEPSTTELEKIVAGCARAHELHEQLVELCSPDDNGWPVADRLANDEASLSSVTTSVRELFLLSHVVRDALAQLAADKNDMMSRALHLLGDISSLQSDFADLTTSLAAVDSDLRSDRVDGFRHLARLKNVLWAYGATLVEVVRRREFARHFLNKSQALAELMAKISSGEKGKRSTFRSDVVGLLPWEVKGIEDAPPTLEITTHRIAQEGLAELSRDDVEALLAALDEAEGQLVAGGYMRAPAGGDGSPTTALSPIGELKATLRDLMAGLDAFEGDFYRLVEIGLLGRGRESGDDSDSGASDEGEGVERARPTPLGRRVRDAEAQAQVASFEQDRLQRELHMARREAAEARREQDEAHDRELSALHAEHSRMRAELRARDVEVDQLRQANALVRRDVERLRSEAETEAERRINMEEELARLRKDAEDSRRAEAEAKAEAREEGERVTELEHTLHDMVVELEEARSARQDATQRIEALLGEGSSAEQELRNAQERIDALCRQLGAARSETREVRELLSEAESSRDKLLRTLRAEADSDRAILEERLREKETDLRRAADLRERAEHKAEEVETLRGQLRAADEAHEDIVRQLESAREAAVEAEIARRHAERTLDSIVDRTRPLLSSAIQLRHFVKAMPSLSSRTSGSSRTASHQQQQQRQLQQQGERSQDAAVERAGSEPTASEGPTPAGADDSKSTLDAEKAAVEQRRQEALTAFEADANSASAEVVLEALRALDSAGPATPGEAPRSPHDEARSKLESLATLVRKWQKAYKANSEKLMRAQASTRDRIAFRNFGRGDLALFLPTRNQSSAVKPWAAFNISFPHHFLNASGALAEQLRTKEWIVARITSIAERVADSSVEGGNPFQLADGVRFFLLDVEGYSGSRVGGARGRTSSLGSTDAGTAGSINGTGKSGSSTKIASSSRSGPQSRRSASVQDDRPADAQTSFPTQGHATGPEPARAAGSRPTDNGDEAPDEARGPTAESVGSPPASGKREASSGPPMAAKTLTETETSPPPLPTPALDAGSQNAGPFASSGTAAPLAAPRNRIESGAQPASLPAQLPGRLQQGPGSDISRSSSPSALTRALRAKPRASSPAEPWRDQTAATQPRTQPWPHASVATDSSDPSRAGPSVMARTTAPAFGRERRPISVDRDAANATGAAAPQSIPSDAARHPRDRQAHAKRIGGAALALNPFSQSPAPNASPLTEYAPLSRGASGEIPPGRAATSSLAPDGARPALVARSSGSNSSASGGGSGSGVARAGTLPRSLSSRSRRISLGGASLLLGGPLRASGTALTAPTVDANPAVVFASPSSPRLDPSRALAPGGAAGGPAQQADVAGATPVPVLVRPSEASSPAAAAGALPSSGGGGGGGSSLGSGSGSHGGEAGRGESTSMRKSSSSGGLFSAFSLGRRAGGATASTLAAGGGGGGGGSGSSGSSGSGSRYPVISRRSAGGGGGSGSGVGSVSLPWEARGTTASEALRRISEAQ